MNILTNTGFISQIKFKKTCFLQVEPYIHPIIAIVHGFEDTTISTFNCTSRERIGQVLFLKIQVFFDFLALHGTRQNRLVSLLISTALPPCHKSSNNNRLRNRKNSFCKNFFVSTCIIRTLSKSTMLRICRISPKLQLDFEFFLDNCCENVNIESQPLVLQKVMNGRYGT